MKIAICDDEKIFCKNTENLINEFYLKNKNCGELDIHTFLSSKKLLQSGEVFDAVFMDISMPDINGIETAKLLVEKNPNTQIIFITQFENLVFEALSIYPFAFIRKKQCYSEIPKIMKKLLISLSKKKHLITLKCESNEMVIDINDIVCFTSIGHNIFAITEDRVKFKIKTTMKLIQKEFGKYGFVRCHISYVVNVRYIFSLEQNKIILDNKEEIPLSRYRAEEVKTEFIKAMR